jgi:hypothetical protein
VPHIANRLAPAPLKPGGPDRPRLVVRDHAVAKIRVPIRNHHGVRPEIDVAELHSPLDHRWELRLTKTRTWSGELPAPLRDVPAGEGVGPVPFERRFLTGPVHKREETVANAETLKAAGEAAFELWLADAVQQAKITWHWL